MNRRDALKTLALSTGAALATGVVGAPKTEAQARDSAGTAPAAPAAAAGPFTLPPLPYAPDALEPHLDARTMQLHHDAHHAAYVNNLNKAVAGKPELEAMSLDQMLRGISKLPDNVRGVVRNHGGGHANHSLLWPSLSKDGPREPQGDLKAAVDQAFGGFGPLQELLTQAGMTVFGSGWAWLTTDAQGGLKLEYTQNQDTPLMNGRTPLLGIDVWEHAYYLKFQGRRAEYLAEFLKVVDWGVVSGRYDTARKG